MAITVKQLIKRLKEYPPDAKVVFINHDQDASAREFEPISGVLEAPEEVWDEAQVLLTT